MTSNLRRAPQGEEHNLASTQADTSTPGMADRTETSDSETGPSALNDLGKNAYVPQNGFAGYLKKSLLNNWGSSFFKQANPFTNAARHEQPPSGGRKSRPVEHERIIAIDQLTHQDIIIALMGPTGAGKTSFINMATGKRDGVGHDLESCTRDIEIIRCPIPDTDRAIVFVDTPGFDDTYRTDVEILQTIADWLKRTYENNIKLSGILYLHRISDNRMAGTPLKNLRVFQELCGKAALETVLLVTTMWEDVDEKVGIARVKELKHDFWNGMIKRGSKVVRFDNTADSAWSMLEQHLFPRDVRMRRVTLLQQELVTEGKRLGQSHAARELYGTMARLVIKQEETLQKLKQESNRGDAGETTANLLMQEYEELRSEMLKTVNEMQELQVPLSTRFVNFFNRIRRPYILCVADTTIPAWKIFTPPS